MDRRTFVVGLVVLAASLMMSVASAGAHGTVTSQTSAGEGGCTVKSLPSFMAQGEFENSATVGDVIEVSCNPYVYSAGAEVTITAAQLYSRCHDIRWYSPNNEGSPGEYGGPSVTLRLDVNGNTNVGLIAGPHCMVGESLITLDENEAPYETFTTSFQVLPTANTPQGLFITPATQVEDQESSAVVTIAQAEFSGASEKLVRIGAKQLFDRCQRGPHLIIVPSGGVQPAETINGYGPELLDAIALDNNGNGFVLLIGSDSCAEGKSLIEADLEEPPFTTLTGNFTIEAPRVRPAGL